jgi:acetyltransferase-like isoleucine patch superfamily enzyme
MTVILRACLRGLRLYVASSVIAYISIDWIRALCYRKVMGFRIGIGSNIFMGCRFGCSGGLVIGDKTTINDKWCLEKAVN